MRLIPALLIVLGLLAPGPTALAQAPADASTRFVARQRLALLLNPMGAEHRLELAGRTALGDQRSLLFTGAHLEAGVLSAVAPVYATGGGYLQLAPVSFFVLRAEVEGEGVWPIGMAGAGYYGFADYDAHLDPQSLQADEARGATGYRASFSGTLQAMVPLGATRVLFLDQIACEYALVGDAAYFYDLRNDIVRARGDWLVKNEAFLGLELAVDDDALFRAGVYDSLRLRPASGEANNQLGAVAMMVFDRPGRFVSSVTPFVRAGYYTHHGSRSDEATVLGGVSVTYDLGGY